MTCSFNIHWQLCIDVEICLVYTIQFLIIPLYGLNNMEHYGICLNY